MPKLVSFERFLGACRMCVHPEAAEKISGESWVWKDLSLAGDDWWEFSVCLLAQLECEAEMEVDIYQYIPHEGNVPILKGGDIKKNAFPDMKLKEVYALTKFWDDSR